MLLYGLCSTLAADIRLVDPVLIGIVRQDLIGRLRNDTDAGATLLILSRVGGRIVHLLTVQLLVQTLVSLRHFHYIQIPT